MKLRCAEATARKHEVFERRQGLIELVDPHLKLARALRAVEPRPLHFAQLGRLERCRHCRTDVELKGGIGGWWVVVGGGWWACGGEGWEGWEGWEGLPSMYLPAVT